MRIQKFPLFLSIIVVLICWLIHQINNYPAMADDPISTLIYDMTPPHEGLPHGVSTKSYEWASAPVVDTEFDTQGFKAMTAWGQLYEDSTGNPATNSRVQIKNIKAYMLSKRDDQWHLLQSSRKVEGAAYREDFAGDVNKPADIRHEKDRSVSVKTGQGYNFHFWPINHRVPINREDIAAIFTTVQARLIIDNPQKPDDRSKARYLLGMGGDYWLSMTAKWDNWTTNGGIGVGKLKYVTNEWQTFNMITLSPAKIRQNPPPIVMD